MSKIVRSINDQTLASLVNDASESARVDPITGELSLPFELANEINDLPLAQACYARAQIKARATRMLWEPEVISSPQQDFNTNLNLMGLFEPKDGPIEFPGDITTHPAAPEWAKRRADEARTLKAFDTGRYLIVLAACVVFAVGLAIHKNANQLSFDKNAPVSAKR